MENEILNVTQTKQKFLDSIYRGLMRLLEENGKPEYKDCFYIEGMSIMCNVPDDYFDNYAIPQGTKIEMKFINKKG